MRKMILMGACYLPIVALVACLGCLRNASETRNTRVSRVASDVGQVTVSAKLSAMHYAPGEDIGIVATVRNGGSVPISLEEGHFLAIFIVKGETRTFLQSVRASYAAGFKTVTIPPGEEYQEPFTVHPKDWGQQQKLRPGRYRLRVCYRKPDKSWRPALTEGATRIEEGIVKTLDSEEVDLWIK